MQSIRLPEIILFVTSLMAVFLLCFTFMERWRFASGKETFTGKCIVYLEKLYCRTAPKEEGEIEECYLSDNVKVVKLYVNGQIRENNKAENQGGKTND